MRTLSAAAFALVFSTAAFASSHREAPFITKNPKVDNTDFYMFMSYEASRTGYVTLISNYQPLQGAYGGPNYFTMDPEALYEIHVDNTGDAVEDLTFQFRFQNTLAGGTGFTLPIALPDGGGGAGADGGVIPIPIALINAGPIGFDDGGFTRIPATQGQLETYSVNLVTGPRRTGTVSAVTKQGGGSVFEKPFENVGSKTFPAGSYDNYAKTFVYDVTIPNCGQPAKMFVGTRKEGFAVNLGPVFDLVNAPVTVITDPTLVDAGVNPLQYFNVTTIALEIHKSCLVTAAGGSVIGAWSTASVRQARVINPQATYTTPAREGGAWAQVSRLGMPLVNEVVIGLPDKDRFNSSEPKDDAANFAKYVFNPTFPAIIELLFPAAPAPRVFPRTDLVTVFLKGVNGVNEFNGSNATHALGEMIRLNTDPGLGPTLGTKSSQGALDCFAGRTATAGPTLNPSNPGCDTSGYPNGRRPGDDVVDITLRVAQGYFFGTNDAPAAGVPLHDAVLQKHFEFDSVFPYLKTPNAGTP